MTACAACGSAPSTQHRPPTAAGPTIWMRLPQDFQILDSDDQYRLIRRVLKALNLDEKHWFPRAVMGYINGKKDEGCAPATSIFTATPSPAPISRFYKTYQETCDRSGLVDFAELLLRAHELWLNKPHILEHYRDRFQNILVDEFQDTNGIQYAWLRMLAGDTGKVMIVGDDDQSIYGWRGAKIENIQRFLTDYQGAETIFVSSRNLPLHRQYPQSRQQRHRQQLRSAFGKELWTERGADFAVRRLQRGGRSTLRGGRPGLERERWLARRPRHPLSLQRPVTGAEEALMQDAMPHRIYGGCASSSARKSRTPWPGLRLINNRGDDASFERVVNTLTRGIGDRTLEILRNNAFRDQGQNLWQSAKAAPLNDI